MELCITVGSWYRGFLACFLSNFKKKHTFLLVSVLHSVFHPAVLIADYFHLFLISLSFLYCLLSLSVFLPHFFLIGPIL